MKRILFLIVIMSVFLFGVEFNNSISNKIEYSFDLNETNVSVENINDDILDMEDDYSLNIAIILDKNKFFEFVPSLLNSINSYMIKKDINYHIKLFNKEENLTKELNFITQNYKYIFTFFINSDDLNLLSKYEDNYFFIPTLNKKDISLKTSNNVFFGGIDYKKQIIELNKYIDDYSLIIYENSDLSKYITTIEDETLLQTHKIKKYPMRYNVAEFNNTFVYLNTSVVNTAQILSNFTFHKIETSKNLSTQINYTPFLFSLTNKADLKNLIIANSIFDINPVIDDNNNNLNSDIDFNWLNFTTSALLNIAYNLETEENLNFINDFNLYMFFNQINYKTNLYKIYNNGFIKIENQKNGIISKTKLSKGFK